MARGGGRDEDTPHPAHIQWYHLLSQQFSAGPNSQKALWPSGLLPLGSSFRGVCGPGTWRWVSLADHVGHPPHVPSGHL